MLSAVEADNGVRGETGLVYGLAPEEDCPDNGEGDERGAFGGWWPGAGEGVANICEGGGAEGGGMRELDGCGV